MDTKGNYYLGRIVDPKTGKAGADTLLYDPSDLTTHAVVVGMTGSGKTGLCIGLLEEAALNNIPALLIDPKGDITNILLHFPDLLPEDFQPWVNPDEARRQGQTIEQAAQETAARWKTGLADWGIDSARIKALKDSSHFSVYTPGSNAGIPISILASFKAPEIAWEEHQEMLVEKISGTVTAILSLVGMTDIDPVRSREHILLSNIFQQAWSQGKDLDLGELILQVQEPPFQKLGVLDINRFFPEKDRFELAMLLNNILASPSFQSWIEGEALDIPSLMFTPDGQSRHSVFYVAHLSDQERMFFITLLYSAVEAWMRTQAGTTTLRAIVYFDEIFGYLPPTKNPPTKQILLRLLKQARAFGVAQVLVTQNPVDLDYKALSNAGTWMIGKLQTDQDKQRLLDGLQGALAGGLERSVYDKIISGLNKRVFLMHNVHESGPQIFQTRWAMNYLAGPLTRSQIPALNDLAGQAPVSSQSAQPPLAAADAGAARAKRPVLKTSSAAASGFSKTRPPVPAGVAEYFLPNNLSLAEAFKAARQDYPEEAQVMGIVYRPQLVVQTSTRYINRTYNLDYDHKHTALVTEPDRRGMVRWEGYQIPPLDDRQFDSQPLPDALFSSLESPLTDTKLVKAMEKDYIEWVFRSSEAVVRVNQALKIYAGPQVSQAEFRTNCSDAAQAGQEAEIEKVTDSYARKIQALEDKKNREARELDQDKAEYSQRKMDEMGAGFDTILGMLGGRRRSVTKNLTKRRMTTQAKADITESQQAIADYQKQIDNLEAEKAKDIAAVQERWSDIAAQSEEINIAPLKKDILVDVFGVAWAPFYQVQTGGQAVELPGFGNV